MKDTGTFQNLCNLIILQKEPKNTYLYNILYAVWQVWRNMNRWWSDVVAKICWRLSFLKFWIFGVRSKFQRKSAGLSKHVSENECGSLEARQVSTKVENTCATNVCLWKCKIKLMFEIGYSILIIFYWQIRTYIHIYNWYIPITYVKRVA